MIKNSKNISDIFVKKITEKWKNIFTKSEIENIWIRSGGSKSRLSFALNILKNHEILTRLATNIYYVWHEKNLDIFYWEIIDILIREYTSVGAILASEKALEWKMFNMMPPQKLVLYTNDFSRRIRLFDGREVHFRTIVSGGRTQGKNLFPLLKQFSQKEKNFKNILFLNPEISLLEALSISEQNAGMNEILILHFLSRNHQKLDTEIFSKILKYRYIRAINRLRVIAKAQKYDDLYVEILKIIKKDGAGCFVSI